MSGQSMVVESKPTRKRVVLVLILLVTLLVAYLNRVNVSVLMTDPQFLADMDIANDPVKKGSLMTVFFFVYGFANIVLGPLGDYFGPRKSMTFAVATWVVAAILGGLAGSLLVLLGTRALLGIGEGLHWPMQSSYVKNWFPPRERGQANSVWLVGLMLGPALAAPLFIQAVQGIGWRNSYYLLALLSFIPVLIIWFWCPDHPCNDKQVNAAELNYIETALKEEAAQAKAALNGAEEGSVASSMKLLLVNYQFWLVVIFYACLASVLVGALAWLPSYLKDVQGFTMNQIKYWGSLPYIIAIVFIIFFGWLSDKVGRRAPFLMLSMIGSAVGIYGGSQITDGVTAVIVLSLGIASVGIGLPCVWALLQSIVSAKAIATGAGLMNGMSNILGSFAPMAMGFFMVLTNSFTGGLMYMVILSVVGALCMLVLTIQKY